MQTNGTPHLSHDIRLKTGGGLKDGWSYLMPTDKIMLYEEVKSAFADEHDKHILEQVSALRKLYSCGSRSGGTILNRRSSDVSEKSKSDGNNNRDSDTKDNEFIFVIQRGSQVAGSVVFDEEKSELKDLVVRPSERDGNVGKDLIQAVKNHAINIRKQELIVRTSAINREWFEGMDFRPLAGDVSVYSISLAKL